MHNVFFRTVNFWFLIQASELLILLFFVIYIHVLLFSHSVTLTVCDPVDCSIPGFSVFHYLPECVQTHVHWVDYVTQPPHPLSPPSLPGLNLSQHQDLFKWVSSSHQVVKVLEFQLQHQSFQRRVDSFRTDWFDLLDVQGTLKSLL